MKCYFFKRSESCILVKKIEQAKILNFMLFTKSDLEGNANSVTRDFVLWGGGKMAY